MPQPLPLAPSFELPIAAYRFHFHPEGSITLGRDSGSTWRSLLGLALARVSCVMQEQVCKGCVLGHSCAYGYLFETPVPPTAEKMKRYSHAPHPYVLLPELLRADRIIAPHEPLQLEMQLFGRGIAYLPYIIMAWKRAGEMGLGRTRGRFGLVEVMQRPQLDGLRWQTIWRASDPRIEPITTAPPSLPPLPQRIRLHLPFPLRVIRNGKDVSPKAFRFSALFNPLLRRFSMLRSFHGNAPLDVDFRALNDLAEQVQLHNADLHWHEWSRYSSRQKDTHPMDGICGHADLVGAEVAALWPYLWFGQWLGVGKGTVMGNGRYELS